MPSDCNADDGCDDSINYFIDSEEESIEINNNENETIEAERKKISKIPGRKSLFGGPSEETFFTLSHTLKAFADLIVYLLLVKIIKYFLASRSNNDPI